MERKPTQHPGVGQGVGGGAPSHVPTEKQRGEVLGLATAGCPHRFICRLIGISEPTLRKHYRHELQLGYSRCIAEACLQRQKAVRDGAPWAICFTLKILPEFREAFRMPGEGFVEGEFGSAGGVSGSLGLTLRCPNGAPGTALTTVV
jgi:hypothetical protein